MSAPATEVQAATVPDVLPEEQKALEAAEPAAPEPVPEVVPQAETKVETKAEEPTVTPVCFFLSCFSSTSP